MSTTSMFFFSRPTIVDELTSILGESTPLNQFAPLTEIRDMGTHVAVSFLLPDVEPENLDIQVGDTDIILSGFRKAPDSQPLISEIYYGKFSRKVNTRIQIDPRSATTEYKNGRLTITVAKAEINRPKYVQVKVGQ